MYKKGKEKGWKKFSKKLNKKIKTKQTKNIQKLLEVAICKDPVN